MEINLANMAQVIGVITFTAWLVKLLIIKPLQNAIDALHTAVEELKNMLCRIDHEQRGIDKRLVAVEEGAKSAHKRIDSWEEHRT